MSNLHIGFTGKKGCGKDLAAHFLRDFEPGIFATAFADPLREVCKAVFGVQDIEMHDRELKEQVLGRYPHESPRQIMQKVGTDCIRNIYPDAWLEAWKRRVAPHALTVTTDCRFLNEAATIRELGGVVVRIIRPSLTQVGETAQHASEMEMDLIQPDYVVVNNDNLEDYRAEIWRVFNLILENHK